LILWISSFLILIISTNEPNILCNDEANRGSKLRLPENETGQFSYTRLDPEQNYRPTYSVYFKNLRMENNKLGIFKTALHQIVKIWNLELRFYRYTSPKVSATIEFNNSKSPKSITTGSSQPRTTTTPHIPNFLEDTAADTRILIKSIIRKFLTPADKWCVNINSGNVSEVLVNNFHYTVFYDNDLLFAIQSKRALASYKQSGIILRGHVTIKTANGSTLESNHIKWDIKKQHFSVNGIYVLNRNGLKTTGKNICVDTQLNNVKVKKVEFKQKENQKCFAKL
jgi:hypothetical protein